MRFFITDETILCHGADKVADQRAASRQGRKHVGAYVPPDVSRQLRVLASQEDTSTQALIEEAIELLFRSRATR